MLQVCSQGLYKERHIYSFHCIPAKEGRKQREISLCTSSFNTQDSYKRSMPLSISLKFALKSCIQIKDKRYLSSRHTLVMEGSKRRNIILILLFSYSFNYQGSYKWIVPLNIYLKFALKSCVQKTDYIHHHSIILYSRWKTINTVILFQSFSCFIFRWDTFRQCLSNSKYIKTFQMFKNVSLNTRKS